MANENPRKGLSEKWEELWPKKYPKEVKFSNGEKPLSYYAKTNAEKRPNEPAMIWYGREITFEDLDSAGNRFANALSDMGYGKGDRLGMFAHTAPPSVIANLGAWRNGMAVVTIDVKSRMHELEYRLNDSEIEVVFCWDTVYPNLKEIIDETMVEEVITASFRDYLPSDPALDIHPWMEESKKNYSDVKDFVELIEDYPSDQPEIDVSVDDHSVILYTAGTTGLPKGAVHTHLDNLYNAWAHDEILFKNCKSAISGWPHAHISGQIMTNLVSYGNTAVLLPRWDPNYLPETLKLIDKYDVEGVYLPTPMWMLLVSNPELVKKYDLSSIKSCIAVDFAGNLTPEISKKWEELTGVPIFEFGLGMSETFNYQFTCFPPPDMPVETFLKGIPLPECDAKIVDLENPEKTLSKGESGEIAVKTPTLFKFYLNKPEKTENSFTSDGWFLTGDVGYIDERGLIFMTGREKYSLKVSGFTVSNKEIEMVGNKCPYIFDIGVIGAEHPSKGEIPLAFVVPGPKFGEVDEDPKKIKEWFEENIASYKVPEIIIADEIPKTPKGAVNYKKLGEKAEEKDYTA